MSTTDRSTHRSTTPRPARLSTAARSAILASAAALVTGAALGVALAPALVHPAPILPGYSTGAPYVTEGDAVLLTTGADAPRACADYTDSLGRPAIPVYLDSLAAATPMHWACVLGR